MIIGNIKDCKKYYGVNERFEKAFEWLTSVETATCDKVLLEGETMWGKVDEDKPMTGEAKYEAHRKYLDIHYILKGTEKFAWSDIGKLTSIQEYNCDGDYEFLKGEINAITMKEGDFCIVFPEDAHIPGFEVETGSVLRALVKIRV